MVTPPLSNKENVDPNSPDEFNIEPNEFNNNLYAKIMIEDKFVITEIAGHFRSVSIPFEYYLQLNFIKNKSNDDINNFINQIKDIIIPTNDHLKFTLIESVAG